MGLSTAQNSLLLLTGRQANLEFNMSMNAMKKMDLARDMSELSNEYNRKLNAKHITFYANGKYNPVNYQYLMGYGSNYAPVMGQGNLPLKNNNSMILTDYLGRVVLGDSYANAIKQILGPTIMDSNGQGSTFSTSEIPKILEYLFNGAGVDASTFEEVINNNKLHYTYNANNTNTLTGDPTGETTTVDAGDELTRRIKQIVDFYYPIFAAAAANGWTTEYNQKMAENEYYIDDAITSGLFQLSAANYSGEYEEGVSMTYFFMNGDLDQRTDADRREEVTAWYNAMKDDITHKEMLLDTQREEMSVELEAIRTLIESIEKQRDDALKSFEWKA